ncbi:MAG: hypothetical protein WB661_09625 [Candidatus Bathyarchaeia archaeon]
MKLSVHLRPKSIADATVNWLLANARSFSYLLPDSLELGLYLGLAAYFAFQIAQQQA